MSKRVSIVGTGSILGPFFVNLGPFESLLIFKGPYFLVFGVNLCKEC